MTALAGSELKATFPTKIKKGKPIMKNLSSHVFYQFTAASLAALMITATTAPVARAASHREAPLIALDPAADNTDTYAFRSWQDPSKAVFIMNVIPGQDPADHAEGDEQKLAHAGLPPFNMLFTCLLPRAVGCLARFDERLPIGGMPRLDLPRAVKLGVALGAEQHGDVGDP